MSADYLLRPEDYLTFMNPRLVSEPVSQMVEWEHCLSFPGVRCMVKRPNAIVTNYLDEQGTEHERKMRDFSARVFLHELDHINGRTMTNWRISEGQIDIIEGKEDSNQHLMTTVNFYKDKIAEMKEQFPDQLFSENRVYDEHVDPEDGDAWRLFKN